MTRNEEAAENLSAWLKEVRDMRAKAKEHLDRLAMMKNATSSSPEWLDKSIGQARDAVEYLDGVTKATDDLLVLAKGNALHDPRRD